MSSDKPENPYDDYADVQTRVSPSSSMVVPTGVADTLVRDRLGTDELAPMPSSAVGELSNTALGRFRVGEVIGRGGMGVVYEAATTGGERAAIKVLSATHNLASVQRFHREARIRIEHQNIVRVLDTGTTSHGAPYIAFELLEGLSLEQRIARQGKLTADETVDIAIQATAGLEEAHANGVVHRDLKPANLFCCDDGTLKILDFGIAHLGSGHARLTRAGMVVGTPSYLAPEQARGEAELDARADIWALGAVMYEALSGRPPFLRDSSLATMLATIMDDLVPLVSAAPPMPPAVCAIVERALCKDPWRRWPDAASMRAALEGVDLTRVVRPGSAGAASRIPVGEQRVVAVLLASGIADMAVLEAAITDKGGQLIPLLGNQAIGLFGAEAWEGDEVQRAVLAGLIARGAAASMAVASGRAAATGAGIAGAVLDAAEAGVAAGLGGLALNLSSARTLGDDYELRQVSPALYEAMSHVQGRALRTSGSGTLTVPQIVVGREAELAQLERAIETVLGEERPVVVSIVGPTGIGKSHLSNELERLLEPPSQQVDPIPVIVGRAEPHQRRRSFSLLQSALAARARSHAIESEGPYLDPGAPVEERRQAIRRLVTEAVGAGEVDHCAMFIGTLFGVDTPNAPALDAAHQDPQLMQDSLRMALQDYFIGLCERGPCALVFEDLQWADEQSLALLEDLAEQLEDQPLLIVVTARPDRRELLELFGGADVVRIEPRPLVRADVEVLARFIARRPLPDSLVSVLAERTGGNPLFVEQIVRALVDENDDAAEVRDLPLPLTVEAAVQSRLDQLPAFEKALTKRASVFGRPFTATEVSALGVHEAEQMLRSLRKKDIVASRGRAQRGEERAYRFRNQLVSDVAYRMIAPDLLGDLHQRAGDYLARTSYAAAEEIAVHFERGNAAGRAAAYYATAALQHAGRGDSEAVVRCAGKAVELGVLPDTRFALSMALSEALEYLGRLEPQDVALSQARESAIDGAQRARCLAERGWWLHRTGRTTEALDIVAEAIDEARACEDDEVLARALGRRAVVMLHAGMLDEACDALDELLAMSEHLSGHLRALLAGWRGQLATARGDLGARKQAFSDAIERYREAGYVRRVAGAKTNLADVYNRVGAYAEAVDALHDALEDCRRVGNRRMEGYALVNLGYAQAMLGQVGEAQAALEQAGAIAEGSGEVRLGLYVRYYAARAQLSAKRPDEAVGTALAVAADAVELKLPSVQASALAVASEAAAGSGDTERALELSARSMEVLEALGSIEEDEAELFLARARALRAAGDSAQARAVASRGLSRVKALAAQIADPVMRARFVGDVPAHRSLDAISKA